MDKLEKALQKAREQRKETTQFLSSGAHDKATPVFSGGSELTLSEMALEAHRIIAHQTRNPAADMFRILRSQVLQAMAERGYRSLAITSPNYGDGKTTIAINLSISIAQDLNQTVLLADLDLRKPSIHSYLGIEIAAGLTEYMDGVATIPDCLVRLPFDRLTLLPAGRVLEKSSETLGSPQMARLAKELATKYPDRMVIYDMPPLLAQDDPLAFLPYVDAVLLVIHDGVTRVEETKRALDILSRANVIGTVLNDSYTISATRG